MKIRSFPVSRSTSFVPLRLVERGDKAAEVSACGWQAAGAYFFNDRFISV